MKKREIVKLIFLTFFIFLVIFIGEGFWSLIKVHLGFWEQVAIHFFASFLICMSVYVLNVSTGAEVISAFFFNKKNHVESLNYFSNLVQDAPDPIVTTDCFGNILSINKASVTVIGYAPEELIGKHISKVGVIALDQIPKAIKEISQLLANPNEIITSEYELISKDHKKINFETKASLIKKDNEFVGIQIIFRDMSEHKKMLGELANRESKYRKLIENLGSEFIIYSHDGVNSFNYLSPSIEKLLGYSSDVFIEKYANLIFKNVDPAELLNSSTNKRDVPSPRSFTIEVEDKHHKIHVLEIDEIPFHDEYGRVVGVEGVGHDLTVCRHMELNQKYENKIVQNILSLIPHYVFWKDKNSVYLGCNKKFADAAGLKDPEEIIGKTDFDLAWKKEEANSYREDDKKVVETGRVLLNYEESQLQADGNELTVLTSKVPLKNEDGVIEGILGIYADISDLKFKETRLKLQGAALEAAFNGIAIVDIKGRITWINSAFTRITGYTAEEVIGKNPRILKSGLTPDSVYKSLWETVLSGKVWVGEMVNRRKDGSFYTEELTVAPVRNSEGKTTHFIGVKQDITQRKIKEESLQLFRSLINQASDSLFIFDFEVGRFVDVNEQACLILEYSKEELLEKSEQEIQLIFGGLSTLRNWSGQQNKKDSFSFETTLNAKVSGTVPADVSIRYTVVNQREYLIISVRNVSEKKKLEELYRQSQKMEAIGRLAGGIAHDFNNLLTVINGNAELSLAELPPEDQRRNDISEILNAGKMAAMLTNQLLTFSRRHTIKAVVVDVNVIIKNTLSMIGRLIGEDIDLEFKAGNGISPIKADSIQLEQVLMNLAVNSRDAMQNGGKITIATEEVQLVENEQKKYGLATKSGSFLKLTFQDTGSGIPDSIKQKVFEPFFTTKAKGEGSGLGLATCYGIINQSGGAITFNSTLGQGTEFIIFIPTVNDAVTLSSTQEKKLVSSSSKKGRIFLVEDEPSVRKLVSRLLNSQGYSVIQAGNGVEAIDILKEQKLESFDLIITDVVMPKMGGRELINELRRNRPNIHVIFMSGYTNQTIDNNDIAAPNTEFIRKPFIPSDFVKKVSEMIA